MLDIVKNTVRPTLHGDLDLLSLPALEAFLDSLDDEQTEVDLSGITFFDSCGLRAFLNVRRRNTSFRIVNPSASVLKVLEITGTDDYLIHGRSVGW